MKYLMKNESTQRLNYFLKTCLKNVKKSSVEHTTFLDTLPLLILNESEMLLYEVALTEKELNVAMMSMAQEKSLGNDGLTKEFHSCFWEELKEPFVTFIRATKRKMEFTSSQKQAVIKLIQKKDREKRFIKNWRPISLLNIEYKIVSKALTARLEKVLPSLITYRQTAYIQNRCISETGRLISDILEIAKTLNPKGHLVTIDIEKAFDSLNHSSLMAVLKKIWFCPSFLEWIEAVLKNQESCVINTGTTTFILNYKKEHVKLIQFLLIFLFKFCFTK